MPPPVQRNNLGDHEKAMSLLDESLTLSRELGMRPFLMERVLPRREILAKSDRGYLILVEAKSHIPELLSSTGAGAKSLTKIRSSLDMTRESLRSRGSFDWTNGFYQYANRLAHLYLLRILN